MKKIVVLGGGVSGLSSAWQTGLLKDVKVDLYESKHNIGGVCGYYDFDGLKLDFGPHKIYSVLPEIMDIFRDLGGDRLKKVKKKHRIVVRGRMLDYPVRIGEMLSLFTIREVISLGFSVLSTIIKRPFLKEPISYEDYCVAVFGKKVYEVVFHSLAEKIWGDPRSLSADIARTRIPTKNICDLLLKMLGLKKESEDTNADMMLYPSRGFYDICECMADEIKKEGNTIHLGTRPVRCMREGNKIKAIVFDDVTEKEVDLLISSIPLRELVALLYPQEKTMIDSEYCVSMRHCIIVYLLVNRPRVMKDHWVFCADKDILFSRFSEQKLLSDMDFPKDRTVISCDFTCDENEAIWTKEESAVAKQCIQGLEKLKVLNSEDIIDYRVAKIPHFYPVYGIGYDRKLSALLYKINQIENVISTGRLGLCNYSNIDHCVDMGVFIARELTQGKEPSSINKELLKRAYSYRIVD